MKFAALRMAPAVQIAATFGLLLLVSCAGSSAGRGTPTAFVPVSGWRVATDPLALRMRAIGARLQPLGLTPEREAFSGFLTAGTRGTHPLELAARTCATWLALASEGIADMDAAIYSPEGEVLAVDSQPDARPTLQVCAGETSLRLYYTLQIYEGAGSFLMAGFTGPRSSLEAAAHALGARPMVTDLGEASAAGQGRVSAFRDGQQRRGFLPVQLPVRVPLAAAQRARSVIAVEPGGCYSAAGFALDGLRGVELRVLDEEGTELARDAAGQEDAAVQFCAERRAEYAAELRGGAGTGAALLLLFRAEAALIGGRAGLWLGERPLEPAATETLDAVLATVTRRARQDGFARTRTSASVQLLPGGVTGQPLSLGAHRCARIHAVGGPGIRRLQLTVVDARGQEVARAQGDAAGTYVHVCTSAAGELEVETHAVGGSGSVRVSVHEAPLSAVMPRGADPAVAAELQQLLRQARDLGYSPLPDFDPQRVRIGASEAVALRLPTEPLRCVRAHVVSRGNTQAELTLAGKAVDSTALGSSEPARFCTGKEAPAEVDTLELRLTSSAGEEDAWVMVLTR